MCTTQFHPYPLLSNRNLGQQCCYDSNGKFISTNKPAGSADYSIPTTMYLQHQSSDYYPYKVCCIDSNDPDFCEKYYEMRPKDNGSNCGTAQPDRGTQVNYSGCLACINQLLIFYLC